jgi:paraquat-inducible protein B
VDEPRLDGKQRRRVQAEATLAPGQEVGEEHVAPLDQAPDEVGQRWRPRIGIGDIAEPAGDLDRDPVDARVGQDVDPVVPTRPRCVGQAAARGLDHEQWVVRAAAGAFVSLNRFPHHLYAADLKKAETDLSRARDQEAEANRHWDAIREELERAKKAWEQARERVQKAERTLADLRSAD